MEARVLSAWAVHAPVGSTFRSRREAQHALPVEFLQGLRGDGVLLNPQPQWKTVALENVLCRMSNESETNVGQLAVAEVYLGHSRAPPQKSSHHQGAFVADGVVVCEKPRNIQAAFGYRVQNQFQVLGL